MNNIARYTSTINIVPETLIKIDEAINIIAGFKRIKKHKPFDYMSIYDDTIVVCYDVDGNETYAGILDYSPVKEFDYLEDEGKVKTKIIKSKNVCVVYDKNNKCKIYGYWGVIR